MIVYLIRDENYFGLKPEIQGRFMSSVLFISFIAGILWTPIVGILYDVVSRRVTLLCAGFLGALLVYCTPLTAPSIGCLILVRSLIAMVQSSIETSPLIMDYVKKESRGKAYALQSVGQKMGEAFAVGVLSNLGSNKGTDIDSTYTRAAGIILVLALVLFLTVKEPKIKQVELKED